MGDSFDLYRAPQFVEFNKEMDDSADAFFDSDHELGLETTLKGERSNYFSPSEETFENNTYPDPLACSPDQNPVRIRRSMSVGNLVLFDEETEYDNQQEADHEMDTDRHVKPDSQRELCGKVESMKIQKDVRNNESAVKNPRTSATKLYRPMSRDNLDRLAKPKKYNSIERLNSKPSKFVSLAESVLNFQNKTPKRFRSRPDLIPPLQKARPSQHTVPMSPALQTKVIAKTRSKTNILSYDERLLMEFQKEQQFKVKANPVNKKILSGPLKVIVHSDKPATIPEPFNLTEPPLKKPPTPAKKYEFRAQPVPKYSENPIKIKTKTRTTEAVTPTFMKHYKKEMVKKHQDEEEASQDKNRLQKPLQVTKPRAFSFENRDKQVQAKRAQLIQQQIEEEKRARKFQAKPVPKFVQKRGGERSRSTSATSSTSSRTKSEENLLQPQFRAKPPTVLYKAPFVPQKPDRPNIEIQPFPLCTEYRALEREEFDKEKEARHEAIKRLQEMREKEREEAEIRRLRMEMEVRAQPIRKYKEVVIVPSNKVTIPVTPKFETDRIRRLENKENLANNVSLDNGAM